MKEIPVQKYREEILESSADETPADYLRYLMGAGTLDFAAREKGGLRDDNEVVNPNAEVHAGLLSLRSSWTHLDSQNQKS